MKQQALRAVCGILAAGILLSSCVVHKEHPHGMPPGQKKKIYGTQSAKPFAPGQQKKAY